MLLRLREVFPGNFPESIVDFSEGRGPEYYPKDCSCAGGSGLSVLKRTGPVSCPRARSHTQNEVDVGSYKRKQRSVKVTYGNRSRRGFTLPLILAICLPAGVIEMVFVS